MLHSMVTPAKLLLSPGLAWRDGGLGDRGGPGGQGPDSKLGWPGAFALIYRPMPNCRRGLLKAIESQQLDALTSSKGLLPDRRALPPAARLGFHQRRSSAAISTASSACRHTSATRISMVG
jgi:hypothetical protein